MDFWRHDFKAMHSGIMDPSGLSTTRQGKVLSMISVIMAIVVFLFILAIDCFAAFVTFFLSHWDLAAAAGSCGPKTSDLLARGFAWGKLFCSLTSGADWF